MPVTEKTFSNMFYILVENLTFPGALFSYFRHGAYLSLE